MKTILLANLVCVLTALVISFGCDSGDDDTDTGAGGQDLTCLEQTCVNDDGNTHTGCACDADYCVPDVVGADNLGATPLTCTAKDCSLDDATTCPDGYHCLEVPGFVIDMLLDDDIVMPQFLCGK